MNPIYGMIAAFCGAAMMSSAWGVFPHQPLAPMLPYRPPVVEQKTTVAE